MADLSAEQMQLRMERLEMDNRALRTELTSAQQRLVALADKENGACSRLKDLREENARLRLKALRAQEIIACKGDIDALRERLDWFAEYLANFEKEMAGGEEE